MGFTLWKDPGFGAFTFWLLGAAQCQGRITTKEARPKPGTSPGVWLGMSSPTIPGFCRTARLTGKVFPPRSGWQGPGAAPPVHAKPGEQCQGGSSGRARCQPHTLGLLQEDSQPSKRPSSSSQAGASTSRARVTAHHTITLLTATATPNRPPQHLHVRPHELERGLCMPWQTHGKTILFGPIWVLFDSKEANPLGFP